MTAAAERRPAMAETDAPVVAADGTRLQTRRWTPGGSVPVRGAVFVAHGMAEHSLRYRRLAEVLTGAGFAVWAHDQRGHGRTASSAEEFGVIADEKGLHLLAEDLHAVNAQLRAAYPGRPVFLIAHSMGSFVAQGYVQRYGAEIDGVILSGSNGSVGVLADLMALVAGREARRHGRTARRPVLDKLSFGRFNDAFRPNRTPFDWLSGDDAEVDAYIADPLCGALFPAGYFYDLARFLKEIHRKASVDRVPANLPICLMSGAEDPVGGKKGIQNLERLYRSRGIRNLTVRLYPGKRHEILNETNRDEVMAEMLQWLEGRLAER